MELHICANDFEGGERNFKVNNHVMNPQWFWVVLDIEAGRLLVEDHAAHEELVFVQFVGADFIPASVNQLSALWWCGEIIVRRHGKHCVRDACGQANCEEPMAELSRDFAKRDH